MIIDSHNHPDWHKHDFDKFIKNMEKMNIDKTWLLSWETSEDEYATEIVKLMPHFENVGPIPFSRCLAYAEKAPEKFVLGYAPDPRKKDAVSKLKAAVDNYGVKVCGEVKVRMMYDNPDAIKMFRFCGEEGLPVVLHMQYPLEVDSYYKRSSWWYGGTIGTLERILKACPETNFIGHAPGVWAHISDDEQYLESNYPKGKVVKDGKLVELLRKYPNFYCDISAGSGLSALKRSPDYTREFMTEFADRILYARDTFHNKHQEFINQLELSQEVLDKIYYKNAEGLIK
jgi:hypothetical protein